MGSNCGGGGWGEMLIFLWLHQILVLACRLFQFGHVGSSSQGSNLGPLHWEHEVLPTAQPGKFPSCNFNGITLGTRQSIYISWIWSQGGKSGRREASQEAAAKARGGMVVAGSRGQAGGRRQGGWSAGKAGRDVAGGISSSILFHWI